MTNPLELFAGGLEEAYFYAVLLLGHSINHTERISVNGDTFLHFWGDIKPIVS